LYVVLRLNTILFLQTAKNRSIYPTTRPLVEWESSTVPGTARKDWPSQADQKCLYSHQNAALAPDPDPGQNPEPLAGN
jgi:hypothetical protein